MVPTSLYRKLNQDAVLLKHGQKPPAAKPLLTFLQSALAKQTIHSFGYHI
ncbi:substrate-binding domain-containing protein [Teredinibacter haidensis]